MKFLSFLILFFLVNLTIFSQNCQDDHFLKGLHKDQTYTATCDSMVVLTKPTYERLRWEDHQKAEIIESYKRTEKLFEHKSALLDSVILQYKSHTDSLDKFLNEKQTQINQLDSLVQRSTKNTEHAISIAKKNQLIAIVSSSLTVVLLIITILK